MCFNEKIADSGQLKRKIFIINFAKGIKNNAK